MRGGSRRAIVRVDGIHVVSMGSGVNMGVCVSLVHGLVAVLEAIRTKHQADADTQTEHAQCHAEMNPRLVSEAHQSTSPRLTSLALLQRPLSHICPGWRAGRGGEIYRV